MINNYKAQRNVRAELSGAVDLGEPVSLYIAEDEVKITGSNLLSNGDFSNNSIPSTWDGSSEAILAGWADSGGTHDADNNFTISNGACTLISDGTNISIEDNSLLTIGKTYRISLNITDVTSGSMKIYYGAEAETFNTTGFKSFTKTATSANFAIHRASACNITFDNVSVYEVTDHTYKLMALNDTIPSGGINVEAEGSDIIENGAFDSADDWTAGLGWAIGSGKATCSANNNNLVQTFDITAGRTYRVTFEIEDYTSGGVVVDIGRGTACASQTGDGAKSVDIVAGSGVEDIRFYGGAFRGAIDDVVVKELYGYDYYNAPAYKFGIVSSIYDQDTGAMKTTGAAGDQLDVTVQGECNIIRSGGSNVAVDENRLIAKIDTGGNPTDISKTTDGGVVLPNAVGTIVETNSGSPTAKAILFQGVEFSEHFVHKNSLQVKAKCDETITKFRPVSLFLDSAGDLLCRHDDIPVETPDSDTDHTGVDPGKWGIAELGGVSGDIIPVTVAGKTHFNGTGSYTAGKLITKMTEAGTFFQRSANNDYTPNALGTVMESGTGDIPITIFNGTPIGTITDWKRTIKVTAKANGAITQYCPVSLYLDQYGNYKCISDDIPNQDTNSSNGIWVDFRKWGIAQETVADGENVEIIVQGRTKVVDAKDYADRGEYVTRINSSGTVTATDSSGYQLSMLGIVEKESQVSDGEPGVIIIF